MSTFKLRYLTTAKSLTAEELELINHNLWLIEGGLNSVGAISPIGTVGTSPPTPELDTSKPRNVFLRAIDFFQAVGTALGSVTPGTTWPNFSGLAYEFVTAPASAPQGLVSTLGMPKDFQGGDITLKAVWAPKVTGASVDTLWVPKAYLLRLVSGTTLYDASGSTLFTSTVLADATTPAKTIYVSSLGSASIQNLEGDEPVRFGFTRDTADSNDTYEDSIYFYGIIVDYTGG